MASNTSPRRVGLLRFLLMGHTVAPGISMAPAVARGAARRRLAAVLVAVRNTPAEKYLPYYPPRRAAFVEDAAMAREMYRL
ncbi:hypothetical protein [Mycolicibacterium fluoranthenivorans]|uniref:Uncharacterized protein n=1 Tax=Mycolicibacterium fluoranthenivorans TaxID=258505 RepID=A0A7X5TY78_9MYCO|nr:hypothetical protein [Mycolicibacterium fluoranthenivorans]MCV7358813.1 hypothetical protein [Mycolicibacterium fluoranthenivorans]NIH94927.1 hypothetical protein [Mycolicibacterium fluoranthenivorans]